MRYPGGHDLQPAAFAHRAAEKFVLGEAGIPFIIATGYGRAHLPERFNAVPHLQSRSIRTSSWRRCTRLGERKLIPRGCRHRQAPPMFRETPVAAPFKADCHAAPLTL
ncbi:MAG: hypothetical protein QOH04_995 [Sphingomonadales bacterium]|jgi:hypothetical protein|nr:hypothetical protein [Sphingomonadales bacterium]